ncbi:nSTAND1 domain-containing NTPase [Bradyrhizobium sp. 521_C7_N1_3]|uniref:nSTAND1 domain-containing NTPase n=1 Tax=Bradyrhizobium sp. 521_C7_N1_3 TaxID=3240368 RepID=UPI003F88C66D
MYDVFISYNSLDHEAVVKVAEALRGRGLAPYLDRWYLVPGISWVDALEKPLAKCRSAAIFLGLHGLGRWQQRERDLALDRQTKDHSFPVIPVLLPGADPPLGFLSQNTWVDLREDVTPEALEILAMAVQGNAPGADLAERVAATWNAICPYRGLRPFREEDEAFFCGREAFTNKLVDVVNKHNLIALVGASGSGKSSVVRAGLVPNLRRRRDFIWEFITIRPQDRPLYNLAAGLIPLLAPQLSEVDQLHETAKLAGSLSDSPLDLRDVVEKILAKQPGTDRLLLVVDQWEELYTLCNDETTRQRFIAHLIDAMASGRCFVILTLRADFYNRVVDDRTLSDRLGDGVVNIGPMTRDELSRSITEPAAKNGLRFEDGLVGRILDDVGREPGNLPLLEFLLTELWEKRHGLELELTVYEAIGGVRRAIAEQAEKTFERLNSDVEREAARSALSALVVPGEGTADTRRRADLNDLTTAERAVIAKFTADRLLVTTRDPSGRDVVEVGHEALIREWDRLRQWVNEDREFLRTLRRVEQDEAVWQSGGQDPSLLLPAGRRLVEAEELLSERPQRIGARIHTYIDASIKSEKARQEGFARAEKEKQDGIRRALIRTQRLAAAIILLAIGVGLSAWVAYRARDTAERHAKITIEFSTGIIEKAGEDLDSGAVSTRAVQELLGIAETALSKLRNIDSTQDLKDQQIGFLLTVSDVYVVLGDNTTALEKASLANQLLANAGFDNEKTQQLLWGSYFRVGDALIEKGDKANARKNYQLGLDIAERFAALKPDDAGWQDHLLFLHDKLGEALRMDGDTRGALEHYDKSIEIEERLIKQYPDKVSFKHRMSATRNRIGDAIADQGDSNKALEQYRTAMNLSKEVAQREPQDLGRRVTLAVRYSRIGATLVKLNDRAGAFDALNTAMDIRKKLTENDQSNTLYQTHLASSFTSLGNFFEADKKFEEAVQYYHEAVKIRQKLVNKDPENKIWQHSLSDAQEKLKTVQSRQSPVEASTTK